MDLPVTDILRAAYDANLDDVVVVGRRPNGRFYIACSAVSPEENMCLLQRGLHRLHAVMDHIEDMLPDGPQGPEVA